METFSFQVFYLGRMECQRLHLVECDDPAVMIRSPVPAVLIRHSELGNLLYDTGNHPLYNAVYPQPVLETYPITEFISIETALAQAGLRPGDIDAIILSHLHFDHAGGLAYFRGTKALKRVYVAESELKHAYYSVMTGNGGAYVKELFDVDGVCFHPIAGPVELAPEITLFPQASHTPGVLGMVLRSAERGSVLFTSDTVYTRESYQQALPPGGHINLTRQEFFDNLEKLREMRQRLNATLFFGHDYQQVLDWAQEGQIH